MTSDRSSESARSSGDYFATTEWTRVLKARGDSPQARAALGDLCAVYYPPVFAFIRRHAPGEEAARDLTQEFFARLLGGHGLDTVDPQRGRFRSFLLGAVKHFLADMRDHSHRLKRGAGQPLQPIESETDTSPGLQLADTQAHNPDREFDRKWALALLGRALALLAEEQRAAGHVDHFETLKPWLTGDAETISQAEAGRRLGLNEGAVKVAVHRLRRRFRELVKSEIGRTLNDPSQVADELACLIAALGGK